ncbi:MAG: carboxypeptidase-like regulatory domain-containing protein [Gemmatimonadales bacterium]
MTERRPAFAPGSAPRRHGAIRRLVLGASLLSVLQGCEIFGGDCTSLGRFALELTLVDETTNQPPTVPPVITATDGAFVDTYPAAGQTAAVQPSYRLVVERAGTYSITVEVPGYHTWQRDGIEVSRGGRCNDLQTERLRVELARQ